VQEYDGAAGDFTGGERMLTESESSRIVRSQSGGQITIPADFREALGIDGESLLQLTLVQGELRIKPVDSSTTAQGSSWLRDAYEAFAPIREELAEKYSEKEIDAAIDQAVKAVRHGDASRRF
jgi:bifunctional DNA-binding transcriptional regulator/antitoxin component of YhaV-PrlF toxin-antitoxin module